MFQLTEDFQFSQFWKNLQYSYITWACFRNALIKYAVRYVSLTKQNIHLEEDGMAADYFQMYNL